MKKIIPVICFLYLSLASASAQRLTVSFNTGWDFHKGDFENVPKSDSWGKVNLPHTWNAQDGTDEYPGYYRGIGWYRKVFVPSESWSGKNVVLYFEGVNQEVHVFLNGEEIGSHKGAFTAFSLEIGDKLIYGHKFLPVFKSSKRE